jgi:hypothetical protein
MSVSRREVLIAGLGLVATGCATASRRADRAQPLWPEPVAGRGSTPGRAPIESYRPIHRATGEPVVGSTPAAAPAAAAAVAGVVSRAHWTRQGLAGRNVNRMNGVKRITLHHEGWTPVNFTSAGSTYDRIEKIRRIHTRDRGWADIGYHYVIDRAGRVIEARSAAYQGAHVSENNPHNLGILVLGNFQEQRPSQAQVEALGRFTRLMMQTHRVPQSRVLTHREINPTECPGRYLQAQVDQLRRRGVIA